MRLLITGSGGFLGKNIVPKFAKEKDVKLLTPRSRELDLLDQSSTTVYFERERPDVVLHMAAVCGGIKANMKAPADFIHLNSEMTINMFNAIKKFDVKALYTLGSVCSYPCYTPVPFEEKNIWNGYPEATNAPYGIAKRLQMEMQKQYAAQYGLKGAHLIPVNLFGECFSSDTFLATPEGWKNVKEFKIGDKIYTLNPDTHNTEIESVIATQKKKSKSFINFKGSVVDLRVTPEHKIYYTTSINFQKRKAEWFIPRAGKNHGMIRFATSNGYNDNNSKIKTNDKISLKDYIKDCYDIKDNKIRCYKQSHSKWHNIEYNAIDFYEFLGWYISEGSINSPSNNQISISQSVKNKEYRSQIKNVLKRMNIDYGEDYQKIYFSSNMFKNFIKKEIGDNCRNKKIPEFLLNADKELLNVLFLSMMKGDGNKGGRRYNTTSDVLKDQLLLLFPLLGLFPGRAIKDKTGCWRIYIRNKKKNSVKYKNISVENLNKEEDVYCVTTERNHIVYAKRNDKCCWVGQCDHFDLENSHVIPALINKFVTAVKDNKQTVELWGSGQATREFLYVEDCAHALHKAVMLELDYPEPINLGTGDSIKIIDLANIIADIVEYRGNIITTGDVNDGQPLRQLDVSRAYETFGFRARTSLREGLIKTITWYKENYEF